MTCLRDPSCGASSDILAALIISYLVFSIAFPVFFLTELYIFQYAIHTTNGTCTYVDLPEMFDLYRARLQSEQAVQH